jgi:hypothetical protein
MLGDPLGFTFSLTTMIAIVGSIASIWLIGGGFTWRLYSGRTAIPPGVDLFAREFSDQTGAATSTGARDDA